MTNVKINEENLENYLDFSIEGYDWVPYSDLSDLEIDTIMEDINQGLTNGSFNTLSGKTDEEVLLTWKLNDRMIK
ncbi:MAG TPA: hypothetical protein DIV40_06350 [Clostridiales bacterium]|mgnify:CR=1 FL=1|nr:hypothetical protein [Clostridiales bacterium]